MIEDFYDVLIVMLNRAIDDYEQSILGGNAKSMEEYRYAVGHLNGLNMAKAFCKDALEKVGVDEEEDI